jgi:hypothetical protein
MIQIPGTDDRPGLAAFLMPMTQAGNGIIRTGRIFDGSLSNRSRVQPITDVSMRNDLCKA